MTPGQRLHRPNRSAQQPIARTLPKGVWTHEAHLRVGLWHALRHADGEALDRLRARISAYNESSGVDNTPAAGYHETLTRFYSTVIRDFLSSVDTQWPIDELAAELLVRCGDRNLPLLYYSRAPLFSTEARLGWLGPDLRPLPGA